MQRLDLQALLKLSCRIIRWGDYRETDGKSFLMLLVGIVRDAAICGWYCFFSSFLFLHCLIQRRALRMGYPNQGLASRPLSQSDFGPLGTGENPAQMCIPNKCRLAGLALLCLTHLQAWPGRESLKAVFGGREGRVEKEGQWFSLAAIRGGIDSVSIQVTQYMDRRDSSPIVGIIGATVYSTAHMYLHL